MEAKPPVDQLGLSPFEAARALGNLPLSNFYSRRWRRRVGLPAHHIGRRLVFLETDIRALLERGREQFGPQTMPTGETLAEGKGTLAG